MSFYVGQRVRVVLAMTAVGQRHVGREAVIIEVMKNSEMVGYGLDIAPIYFDMDRMCYAVWGDHQLVPIAPPGLESLEEINQLYEPEPEVIRG